MGSTKEVVRVFQAATPHWVGDGFHVRNLFPNDELSSQISPFLLLDYAGPTDFPPARQPRGVGEHPHRGFETVTIGYQGELEHRDSAGNHGTLGPGDVQWMSAASGVVHEEMHEAHFAERGGIFQVVQLWVNLPKSLKMSQPRYQTLAKASIPVVDLPNGGGVVRVIAGEFQGAKGPAKTYTPINLFDVRLKSGHELELVLPEGFNTGLFVLSGEVVVNGSDPLEEAELALLTPEGTRAKIRASEDATLLVLNGEPIDEPIAWMGPFVMNTREEVLQAAEDYRAGKMGHLD